MIYLRRRAYLNRSKAYSWRNIVLTQLRINLSRIALLLLIGMIASLALGCDVQPPQTQSENSYAGDVTTEVPTEIPQPAAVPTTVTADFDPNQLREFRGDLVPRENGNGFLLDIGEMSSPIPFYIVDDRQMVAEEFYNQAGIEEPHVMVWAFITSTAKLYICAISSLEPTLNLVINKCPKG
jgi:hypothetical protein